MGYMSKNEIALLKSKISRLLGLVDVSSLIISTLEITELLHIIMDITTKVMRAEASSLMLVDKSGKKLCYEIAIGEKSEEIKKIYTLNIGQGIAGWVAQNNVPLNIPDVKKDKRFFQEPDMRTGFNTRSIICVPMTVKENIIGVLQAINPIEKKTFSNDDLEIFSAFASQAAIAIDNARMQKYKVQQQMMERELSIAEEIQQNFLPCSIPTNEKYDIFASNTSAYQIGGDFYDFVQLGKNRMSIIIGDVSGKGIPAALYMVKALTSLREGFFNEENPVILFERLNNTLVKESTLGMFVTVLMIDLKLNGNEAKMLNCGHMPGIKYNALNKNTEILKSSRCPPLGVVLDAHFSVNDILFENGDIILLYTDGITEAENVKGEYFGIERLLSIIKKEYNKGSCEITQKILSSVKRFSQPNKINDDLTIVVIKKTEDRKQRTEDRGGQAASGK